jgi:hypothetical protein
MLSSTRISPGREKTTLQIWMFLMRHAPRIQEAEFVPRMFVIGSKMLSATVARLTEVGS